MPYLTRYDFNYFISRKNTYKQEFNKYIKTNICHSWVLSLLFLNLSYTVAAAKYALFNINFFYAFSFLDFGFQNCKNDSINPVHNQNFRDNE